MSKRRHTASTITDDDLEELYDNASRGWRRGDRWKARALAAEAALERAEKLARRCALLRTYGGAAVELRAALTQPEENSKL